ncbi:MAG: nucleotidyl transferase AbiEii/AbiGii toxin family protein, partial [Nitrospiraceae bacterium]
PSRPPTLDDLTQLCQALNDAEARYVLIGGFAVNYYGRARATEDIDFLVDPKADNIRRIKVALHILPDHAADELREMDVASYTIVRIADEIVVDLIGRGGSVTYETAEIQRVPLGPTTLPIASLQTLIATKQGLRPRDQEDLAYLETLQAKQDPHP